MHRVWRTTYMAQGKKYTAAALDTLCTSCTRSPRAAHLHVSGILCRGHWDHRADLGRHLWRCFGFLCCRRVCASHCNRAQFLLSFWLHLLGVFYFPIFQWPFLSNRTRFMFFVFYWTQIWKLKSTFISKKTQWSKAFIENKNRLRTVTCSRKC